MPVSRHFLPAVRERPSSEGALAKRAGICYDEAKEKARNGSEEKRVELKKLHIAGIPALLWGGPADRLILAVHGSHSSKLDDCIWVLAEEAVRAAIRDYYDKNNIPYGDELRECDGHCDTCHQEHE